MAENNNALASLSDLERNEQPFVGDVLLGGVNIRTARNGNPFAVGEASDRTRRVRFIKFSTAELPDGVYRVTGRWNYYDSSYSLLVDSADLIADAVPEDYMPDVYGDVLNGVSSEFIRTLDPEAQALAVVLFVGDGSTDGSVTADWREPFKREVAALHHHDAVKQGLLAHSVKTAQVARAFMDNPFYFWGETPVDRTLVVVGALTHDLGKVMEYSHGGPTAMGAMLSHRTIMVERVMALHDRLVKVLAGEHPDAKALERGEERFQRLVAIYAQHHGQFEETPRCVEAYLVHVADDMEARITDVSFAFRDDKAHGPRPVGDFWLA